MDLTTTQAKNTLPKYTSLSTSPYYNRYDATLRKISKLFTTKRATLSELALHYALTQAIYYR